MVARTLRLWATWRGVLSTGATGEIGRPQVMSTARVELPCYSSTYSSCSLHSLNCFLPPQKLTRLHCEATGGVVHRVHRCTSAGDSRGRDVALDYQQEGDIVTPKLRRMLKDLLQGSRARLAEAITLVESKHPMKHKQAQWLLSQVLSHRNKQQKLGKLHPTVRVGLSGPPGAGKSTLVEVLGLKLIDSGLKVAVLAVDPTSSRTGGSILGDKTRMTRLAHHPNAYIRPSPTSGSLGGVTRSTNEAILLCEGAGYDIVLVETVGVGQSEISVSDMVDVFLLVIPPAAGDELQGIKRGIVEVSDIITVNKADGDLLPAARRIKAEYVSAVKLTRSKSPNWRTKVLMASALKDEGVSEMWSAVEEYVRTMRDTQEFDLRRQLQRKLWMWNHIDWELAHRFRSEPAISQHIRAMEGAVLEGSVAPGTAADVLLEKFINTRT